MSCVNTYYRNEYSHKYDNRYYIVVNLTHSKSNAIIKAENFINQGYNAAVYYYKNQGYAVALGRYSKQDADNLLNELFKIKLVDDSVFVTKGNHFRKKIFPN